MYIYNPATQESIKLCKLPSPQFEKAYLVPGFGFDSSSKQYKVVQLSHTRIEKNGGDINTEAQVLTLGGLNSSWRRLENVPKIESYVGSSSAVVNGVLYWITTGKQILSFDLVSEKFELIAFPPIQSLSSIILLMNLSGYLTVAVGPCRYLELWMLKDSNEHGSWTTLRIKLLPGIGGNIFPICLWKENEILLLCNSRILICYSFYNGEYGPIFEIDGIPKNKEDSTTRSHSYEVYPYVANLISLNLESVSQSARSKGMKGTLSATKKQMQERC
ncbi:F-box domain [Thalictrum thalictroides]|uniref:F-box domain n=1 Tax=Thalictrum thalictroides TaxID=46969 RepID=A0A7J6XDF0_THATH|nr:F-box domain [Thalictrum thalictroides]